MNARTSETFRQKDHFNIFIIFVVSKDLSFKSQTKSTILKLITQN